MTLLSASVICIVLNFHEQEFKLVFDICGYNNACIRSKKYTWCDGATNKHCFLHTEKSKST